MVNKKTFARMFNRYGSFITGFNLPLEDSIQDKQTNVPTEVGINEKIRDEKGDVVETIRKARGSDTTIILKKEPDKRIYRLVKTPINQKDEFYEIEKDVPIDYKSPER